MLWLHHAKFVRTRDEVLRALNRDEYTFRNLKSVLFVCGGYQSRRRVHLTDYIASHLKEEHFVYHAEDVWAEISKQKDLDALQMEEKLAQISDAVIIILESPGTFAELGAFALSSPLRRKLLPIVDKEYQHARSFINTGPIAWIDQESQFAPTIWCDLNTILECCTELKKRLDKIPTSQNKSKFLEGTSKHLLFFVCDIVAIFGPCPIEHIIFYINKLNIRIDTNEDIRLLLELAQAMRLLDVLNVENMRMYFMPLVSGRLATHHYTKKYFGIANQRAKVLGAMYSIEEASKTVSQLQERSTS